MSQIHWLNQNVTFVRTNGLASLQSHFSVCLSIFKIMVNLLGYKSRNWIGLLGWSYTWGLSFLIMNHLLSILVLKSLASQNKVLVFRNWVLILDVQTSNFVKVLRHPKFWFQNSLFCWFGATKNQFYTGRTTNKLLAFQNWVLVSGIQSSIFVKKSLTSKSLVLPFQILSLAQGQKTQFCIGLRSKISSWFFKLSLHTHFVTVFYIESFTLWLALVFPKLSLTSKTRFFVSKTRSQIWLFYSLWHLKSLFMPWKHSLWMA